ncbi:hypothetical protein V3C99_000450 [Haemonchus contortus]
MDTPLGARSFKDRRAKRRQPITSPAEDSGSASLIVAIGLLNADTGLPPHLKTIRGHLLDKASETEDIKHRNQLLEERLEAEVAENARLKDEIETLKKALSASNNSDVLPSALRSHESKLKSNCCADQEMSRSIIILGLAEDDASDCTQRVSYLFDRIRKIFQFLDIECAPNTFYRMGKSNPNYPRLVKVVLPST